MNRIILSSIVAVVFMMTIGYSARNSELTISGELTYRSPADMRITNVSLANSPTNAEVLYNDYTKKEIHIGYKSSEATTSSSEASVTLKVEITNFTDIEMGILKIENLPENAIIEDYTLKEKLKNSDGVLHTGMKTTFNIILKSSAEETKELILIFDFEPFVSVIYEGTGFSDTINLKKDTIMGGNFNQKIAENIQICSVKMKERTISNYTFSNQVITIPDVTGNIVITGDKMEPILETPITTPNPPELNGDMIPVYYDEDEAVWKKADINNADNNWYDYDSQKWANAVTVYKEPTITDLSSSKKNGTSNGALIGDGVASFDGIDDYIDTGLQSFSNNVTLVLRFKFNELPSTDQFRLFNNGSVGLYYNTSSQFKFHYSDTITNGNVEAILKKEVNLSDYYTVVGTYNGTTLAIYVNGEKESKEEALNIKTSKNNFIIGGTLSGGSITRGSNISVSDVLVFDQGLSEEEIKAHYSGEVTLGETQPILYYNFDGMVSREYMKNAPVGTVVPEKSTNTMWVWIPRYSYTIKSEDGGINYYGKATDGNSNPTRELPGEIDVKFISTSSTEKGNAQYSGVTPKRWHTNEAFNFGGVNKAGIWVSKFEASNKCTEVCENTNCDVSNVRSMPGNTIITNKNNADFFYMARSMQVSHSDVYVFDKNSGDLHMIKNDEWGAVAYLSQSKYGNSLYSGINKKIYVNSFPEYKAGRSNGDTTGVDGGEYGWYDDYVRLGDIVSEKSWMVRGGRCSNDHAGIFNSSNVDGNKSTGHSTRFILVP